MKSQNHSSCQARMAKTPGVPDRPQRLVGDVIVITAGVFIILLGIVLLFLPGPGLLLIAVGVVIAVSRVGRVWTRLRDSGRRSSQQRR